MEKVIGEYLSGLHLGGTQTYKNLALIPLLTAANGGPHYLTLKQAMDQGTLMIAEISEGGAVPELKVKNNGDTAVLLLDGEEVSGAKQNRVLNTTILIAAHTETVIPVSCTEHGRWGYTSRTFADSGVVMASRVRREKVRSVAENLKTSMRYNSDQGEVWNNISAMAADADVQSATGAMKDVFTAKESELDDYLAAVRLEPGQKGAMFFINGSIVGLDCLSLDSAYAVIHPKLVKSYAMEAILGQKKKPKDASVGAAKAFLEGAAACAE